MLAWPEMRWAKRATSWERPSVAAACNRSNNSGKPAEYGWASWANNSDRPPRRDKGWAHRESGFLRLSGDSSALPSTAANSDLLIGLVSQRSKHERLRFWLGSRSIAAESAMSVIGGRFNSRSAARR